ncbi:conjugative relaxase domain protein [Burkholderia pseudomallei MSHR5613]|nr:conjugative relaxase domain protein [Burkholderia pseudomallei MSHR5613]
MLTLAKVTTGAAAASYYESADDYYAEDGQAPSAWWGTGTTALGLSGPVDAAAFKALLDGELPDGTTMHNGGEGPRRAGTDLTFSAPKSVSMQALIAGDQRLLAAHDTAVARVLAHIEEHLAACRVTVAGDTYTELTGSLAVVGFRHDLSRDADPQLHTHAVLLNLTQRSDGRWRALDATALYAQQLLLGALYRAELAREVQALGYAVRLSHPDGRFELASPLRRPRGGLQQPQPGNCRGAGATGQGPQQRHGGRARDCHAREPQGKRGVGPGDAASSLAR